MSEIWKAIPETDGKYEVSCFGRIRSHNRETHLLKLYNERDGRVTVRVSLSRGGTARFNVHRLVAAAFCPNPEGLPLVNHLDNDAGNNCASNLEWCTNAQNLAHCAKQGRMGKLLTGGQVVNIRKHLNLRILTQSELGHLHGVHPNNINLIATGKIWSQFQGEVAR